MANCPMCNRELIDGPSVDRHHMIPRSRKGMETELIHRVCHQKIHTVWTEKELEYYYHTWERICSHPEIEKFVKWVSKKDPEYTDINRDTKNRKKKRKK